MAPNRSNIIGLVLILVVILIQDMAYGDGNNSEGNFLKCVIVYFSIKITKCSLFHTFKHY